MKDIILMETATIIEEDHPYTNHSLSLDSVIGKDCLLDELDIVQIISRLEEEMAVEFDIVDVPQEVLKMTLLEFSEFLESKVIA